MPHYMLVKNTKEILKKLICEHCGYIQKKLKHYKTHESKCVEGRVHHVYTGGFHKQPLGIREKLESIGITLPEHQSCYNNFICYDFEAMFKEMSKKTDRTEYLSQDSPVSYVNEKRKKLKKTSATVVRLSDITKLRSYSPEF